VGTLHGDLRAHGGQGLRQGDTPHGVHHLGVLLALVVFRDGVVNLREVGGPAHHLDGVLDRGVGRVGDPEGGDGSHAAFRIRFATLVNGTFGRVAQVGLDDVAGDVDLLIGDLF